MTGETHVPRDDSYDIVLTRADGSRKTLYAPHPKQVAYHKVNCANFLLEGERGTGKSTVLRWDCHLKALAYPGYKYLILRRTMPELRKSHLTFITSEMDSLGGVALGVRTGTPECHYANGSFGVFGHCETEQDVEKYLSAEFYTIVFDEIVTFPWEWITRIKPSCRVPKGSGLTAHVRGGTNPLGQSAEEVNRYFIARDVTKDEDPEYVPEDWGSLHMTMDDNPSLDKAQYLKQFAGIPEAYRKAWLRGEWGIEGAYFSLGDDHTSVDLPVVVDPRKGPLRMLDVSWLHVYRLIDYGWHDPTVCVWVCVLPNGREIPFMEEMWTETPAAEIARDIAAKSAGMRVITTIGDPTMWDGLKEMGHCIADEFEQNGVPMTRGKNDRTAAGMAIQQHLNNHLQDGLPKLIIYEPGCPVLLRSLRSMRVDKKRPGRIADHKMDHMPICLGYFCMADVGPSRVPRDSARLPGAAFGDKPTRNVLGSEGVR